MKKFSEILRSEICTKWEKFNRAQEQRIDEVSVQKLRENRETIQQLTSQLQQTQEQMNYLTDSGDFHDVESSSSGRLSQVSSQLAMIPSSLDTWNQSGSQENVFGNQFSTFDSPTDYSPRIQSDDVQRNRGAVPGAERTKTGHTSEDRQNQGTIRMPTFATKPWTTSSTIRWNFCRTAWSDGKDRKSRNCKSTNFRIHNRFQCGKFDSKIKRLLFSDFPSDAMFVD